MEFVVHVVHKRMGRHHFGIDMLIHFSNKSILGFPCFSVKAQTCVEHIITRFNENKSTV